MTQAEAIAEAKRRWGKCGTALVWDGIYRVYRRASELMGQGDSWEAAFQDADDPATHDKRLAQAMRAVWEYCMNNPNPHAKWLELRQRYF